MKIRPIISYAVATYVFVLPSFLVNFLGLSPLQSFLIISIPYGGRLVGSILFARFGHTLSLTEFYKLMLGASASLSLLSALLISFPAEITIRLIVGVVFGLMSSMAMYEAMEINDRKVIGGTLGGWAIGWTLAGITSMILKSWTLAISTGALSILLLPLISRGDMKIRKTKAGIPSPLGVLTYLLSFVPAFSLSLAPYFLEINGYSWDIVLISYVMAIPMYFVLPALSRKINPGVLTVIVAGIASISGVLFFDGYIYFLLPFTMAGLGLNSITPVIARRYGINSTNSGIAINSAALGGVVYPVIPSMMDYSDFSIIVGASTFAISSLVVDTKKKATQVTS
ncbi:MULTISPECIES: hypothetical protein [Metallosphaera]|uniref:Transporter n=3 Tax=Metallosphaera TaxID=41980 RepID=A4YDG8_METS5|nr:MULTISPECIES: hypothetical protein [Metallosphaera]ABP94470.1 hypothetical protein Msed_0293 [Metallosphaera sedula DSM 5348]AIM26457.1 hypothetical protein HA72_0293 [Metallosphaera sedula]AKV73455.1 hypothetical protein MsedA_0304 [Metallosphaera sedula]AKV75697.1 hypothetical protein MsedB_0304 [Metallosphaera sedula]AKV77944.1 hypothetical protein MsedC_0303 [Metallosphaera sedula]